MGVSGVVRAAISKGPHSFRSFRNPSGMRRLRAIFILCLVCSSINYLGLLRFCAAVGRRNMLPQLPIKTVKTVIHQITTLLAPWHAGWNSSWSRTDSSLSMLQVPRDASKSDISRAYRMLSLQFHPDKNPDPAAGKYFAEFITKAYKALTGASKPAGFCLCFPVPQHAALHAFTGHA